MKAAVIHAFGDADVLKVEEIATPKPKAGHVLVKVLAAGINRLDHYIRGGSIVPELSFSIRSPFRTDREQVNVAFRKKCMSSKCSSKHNREVQP